MSATVSALLPARRPDRTKNALACSPLVGRTVLLAAACAALVAGFVIAGPQASQQAERAAGPELTHLLRAMAVLKALMATGAVAAIVWRLGIAVSPIRLAAYALACAVMSAGPGLIWTMAYMKTGALLLHGGLLAAIILVWRDPATSLRLSGLLAARRRALAGRG